MRWPLRILWDSASLKEDRRDSPGVCGRSPGAPQNSCFCVAPALFSWGAGFEGWAKCSSGVRSALFCPKSKVEKKEYGVLEHLSTVMKKSIYISHETVDQRDVHRNLEEASQALNWPLLLHSDGLWWKGWAHHTPLSGRNSESARDTRGLMDRKQNAHFLTDKDNTGDSGIVPQN